MNHPKTKGIVTFYSQDNNSNVGTAVQWRLSVDIQGRGSDHIAFRDHNAVFVLGAEAIATNFLSVVLF